MMLSFAISEANRSQELMLKLKKQQSLKAKINGGSSSSKGSLKSGKSSHKTSSLKTSKSKKQSTATVSVSSASSGTISSSVTKSKPYARDFRVASINLSQQSGKVSINESLATALKTNSDVIVLNEYHFYEQSESNTKFMNTLKDHSFTLHYANTFSTTAIASRMPVVDCQEISISDDHSAVFVCVNVPKKDEQVWICSTAFSSSDAYERESEVDIVTDYINSAIAPLAKVVIVGDVDNANPAKFSDSQSAKLRAIINENSFDQLSELAKTWTDDSLDAKSTHSETTPKLTAAGYTFSRNVYGASFFESSNDGLSVCDWYL